MFLRIWIVGLLLHLSTSGSCGEELWGPLRMANFLDDEGYFGRVEPRKVNCCDACDMAGLSDNACDTCGQPYELQGRCDCGQDGGGYCWAAWQCPAENCIDRFIPRSNLPFPLLQGLVEGRDVTLPLTLGTGVIFTELDRTVEVEDVRLALGNAVPTSAERVEVPRSVFHASSQIFRLDLWTLPCLNIYGLVGHTRTTGDVAVTVNQFPFPFSPPVEISVPVSLSGTTAGLGATAGIGGKSWFAALDINKSWTNFTRLDSSLTALVIAPRVGVPIDRSLFKGEVHVGAMWQDTAQTVELTVNHPILGNGLKVEVDQIEPRPWNFLVGGLWAFNERLMWMVEGGMGGRSYVITGITLRH